MLNTSLLTLHNPDDPAVTLTPKKSTVSVDAPTGEVTGTKLVNNALTNNASVGDTLTYSIVLTHTEGTSQWTGSITDQLPDGVSYQSGTTKINGMSVSDTDVWQGTLLTVSNLVLSDDVPTVTVTFQVIVASASMGKSVTNKVSIIPDDPSKSNTPYIPEKTTTVAVQASFLYMGEQASIYLMLLGFLLVNYVTYKKNKEDNLLL